MPAAVHVVSPQQGQASDGRIVIVAPAGTERVRLRLDGGRAPVRVLARQPESGGVRFELQTAVVAREGASLGLEALDASGALTGSAQVADVHLLGEGAFAGGPGPLRADARAGSRAAAALAPAGGLTGVSAACLGAGRLAEAGGHATTRAASTLKVAILLAAFARKDDAAAAQGPGPTYTRAIIDSDNEAANQVLAEAGGGDTAAGTRAVNDLFRQLGMADTYLDGPYVAIAGRSRKTTSAADLRTLGTSLIQTARDGSGPLGRLGVSAEEARIVVGLMSSAAYPGLVREHVPEPVAHKAGWLDDQQNDLAIVFGGEGGPCVVGIVTEGLSFGSADAVGRQIATSVLPVLGEGATAQAPPAPRTTPATTAADDPDPATTEAQGTSTPAGQDDPPSEEASVVPRAPDEDGGIPWLLVAGVGALAVIGLAVARRAQVVRRRARRRAARRSRDGG